MHGGPEARRNKGRTPNAYGQQMPRGKKGGGVACDTCEFR